MKKISQKEKIKNNIRAKAWYLKNKKRKKEYDQARHKSNPAKFAVERKDHYEKNKEQEQAAQRIYGLRPKSRYKRAINSAIKRKKAWNISENEYTSLISQKCFYDGVDLSAEFGIGLDRIDNSKGYSIDNVVPCCGSCNITRGDRLTHEEMVIAINAVLEFRKGLK